MPENPDDPSEGEQDPEEEVTIETEEYCVDDEMWVSMDDLIASGWVPPEDTDDDLPVA